MKSMPLITKLHHSDLLSLTMKDGDVIPYVSKCLHLGTTIYTKTLYRDNVLMSSMNCINPQTIFCQIFFLLRVALYPIYLRVFV